MTLKHFRTTFDTFYNVQAPIGTSTRWCMHEHTNVEVEETQRIPQKEKSKKTPKNSLFTG